VSQLDDRFSLVGKVAVVTGAGGRGNSIGRAYALGLAGAGAAVVVADLNEAGAGKVADEITAAGGRAIAVGVDITDPAQVARLADRAKAAFGGVDILVNNAALMAELSFTPASQVSVEEWNRVLAVNLTGALICSQAMAPLMRERGGGKIVNQVSAGAYPAASVYGVSKIALVGLTTTLAKELGGSNITVNAIAPGITMSDAGKSLTPEDSPFVKTVQAQAAIRVRGTPDDLVGALLLLCSKAGDWMSGQVLHVDGGFVIRP
jgi:NAD(P)-dependent dehydrogenase (short-subunit alcohol dehydrogenase family)